jgi:alpha-glucan,water dikinase
VDALGRVLSVEGLHEIQDEVYEEPTVIIAQRVTGEEEVPEGAVAVLTPDAPDVLSHVSVRARNMKVLFAICHDPEELAKVAELNGEAVSISVTAAGGVEWEKADLSGANGAGGEGQEKAPKRKVEVKVPKWCGKWVVSMDEFADGVVGAKSKNLSGLRGELPESIALPASVTVPFGSFEEVLKDGANADVAKRLKAAVDKIPSTHAEPALAECRAIVMEVEVPAELQTELKAKMQAAGIPVPDSEDRWAKALAALKGVWASMYNERAMLSMRKVGIDFRDIRMAVLCQRVVPAAYAFVIHTTNPSNGDENEIYAELVAGLGEAIVSGMVPGTSLSFTAKKDALGNPQIVAYPSKSDGLFVPESLIFRSDSNGEDLAGYAGAGLYDSITMDATVTRKVDYGSDQILTDEEFRTKLLTTVAEAGAAVEKALQSAQDIEGVIDADGNLTVVQTRPQM